MIRALKWKFVMVNMLLVSMVLLIVLAAMCLSSYQSLLRQCDEALMVASMRPDGIEPPKFSMDGRHERRDPFGIATFSAMLDGGGAVIAAYTAQVEVSDELLSEAVAQASSRKENRGTLGSLRLRYLRQETPQGTRLTFADMSALTGQLVGQIGTLLLALACGLGAFFIISLFLSNWALRPTERAWAQQRRFVADASHELKTPLTVILANLGILKAHPEDALAEQMRWVENSQAEAKRMKSLVDEMLFLAKSGDADAPIRRAEVSLSEVLWRGVLPFEPVAFEAGVALQTEAADGVTMHGDEAQLSRLIAILLDNALKYAGENGTVKVKLTSAGDRARISVHNTGAPIPKAALPHLFERFYRADKSRARTEGGYGLGLSIAKQIVENHRGKITAESNEKEGTTFTVILPKK